MGGQRGRPDSWRHGLHAGVGGRPPLPGHAHHRHRRRRQRSPDRPRFETLGVLMTKTAIDTTSAVFAANREAALAKLADLEQQLAAPLAGGGEKYVQRHHDRGKLTPRERIELLVDEDTPFL